MQGTPDLSQARDEAAATTQRPIRFVHRGRVVEVPGSAPTRSVLDWLREDARCTGTKEGCAEGDCGACTVVVGTRDEGGALRTETVNACIQFLPMIDGKALFTVEDLGARDAGSTPALHPVQQAMVDAHGSQCGFCTPGFVMSLWACALRHRAAGTLPTRQQLADELSGNLCRCTGYRPILDAGERACAVRAVASDDALLAAAERALQVLANDPPLVTEAAGAILHAPRSVAELARLRLEHPQATLLAGATDIGLWVNKQMRTLPALISVGAVAELARIDETDEGSDGHLVIGAGASLEAAWSALAKPWPALTEMGLRFASPPVRHAGTMGGNLANGSPIGDSAPVLMALDASLVLQRGERIREVRLADFYTGYLKNRLEAGEFVRAIRVPLAQPPLIRAYKLSKRFDSDISAVSLGAALALDGNGDITTVRLAYGGLAAVVKRAAAAEAALLGKPWTEPTLRAAQAALASDFQPLSDHRASAAYRLQVAANWLERLWLETRSGDAIAPSLLSVWARETVA